MFRRAVEIREPEAMAQPLYAEQEPATVQAEDEVEVDREAEDQVEDLPETEFVAYSE